MLRPGFAVTFFWVEPVLTSDDKVPCLRTQHRTESVNSYELVINQVCDQLKRKQAWHKG